MRLLLTLLFCCFVTQANATEVEKILPIQTLHRMPQANCVEMEALQEIEIPSCKVSKKVLTPGGFNPLQVISSSDPDEWPYELAVYLSKAKNTTEFAGCIITSILLGNDDIDFITELENYHDGLVDMIISLEKKQDSLTQVLNILGEFFDKEQSRKNS